jgi:hypothetical protein
VHGEQGSSGLGPELLAGNQWQAEQGMNVVGSPVRDLPPLWAAYA